MINNEHMRLLLTALITFFLISSASTIGSELPELGDSSGTLITAAQEKELGGAWLRSLRRQVATLDDPLVSQYIRDLVFRLAPNSELQDRDLKIVIVDSNALNAFAVPGGVIGINAGLLLYAENEQEIAGVIAHELAHLSQRHFARKLEEARSHTALNMAGLLASVVLAAAAGTDAGVAALASVQAYSIQEQLKYSRQNEQEADRIGIATLVRTGMDPRAMASMFRRMLANNRFNRKVPEYLRTHPLTENRVADTFSRATQYPPMDYSEDIDFYLMQSRVRAHYSPNPGDSMRYFKAVAKNSTPHINLAAKYGGVLSAISANKPSTAEQAMKSLLSRDDNRISVVTLYAEWLLNKEEADEAKSLLEKHLERNPDNYPLSRVYAKVLTRMEDYAGAEKVLQKLTKTHSQYAGLWRELAEVNGLAGSIVDLHQARAEYFYLTGRNKRALRQLRQALTKSGDNYQQTALIHKRLREISAEEGRSPF